MFGRRLLVGVKSLGLDAAMLVSFGCPGTHCAILEVLMDTVATYYGFIVERTRDDPYWTVGSSTLTLLQLSRTG